VLLRIADQRHRSPFRPLSRERCRIVPTVHQSFEELGWVAGVVVAKEYQGANGLHSWAGRESDNLDQISVDCDMMRLIGKVVPVDA
jgi:hypothetical protein